MLNRDPYEDVIQDEANLEMRAASGRIDDDRPLVAFLYCLVRDHIPSGQLDQLIDDVQRADVHQFTNGWLAEWAKYTADRLGVPSV